MQTIVRVIALLSTAFPIYLTGNLAWKRLTPTKMQPLSIWSALSKFLWSKHAFIKVCNSVNLSLSQSHNINSKILESKFDNIRVNKRSWRFSISLSNHIVALWFKAYLNSHLHSKFYWQGCSKVFKVRDMNVHNNFESALTLKRLNQKY